MSTQAERLDTLQTLAGFSTLADFARAAGVEPGTARQQRNRNSIPIDAAQGYVRAASRAGASVEWLLYGTGQAPKTLLGLAEASSPLSPPKTQLLQVHEVGGKPDVPVWASAEGGMDGAIILTPDPIDYIRRSERMLTVKNPFAFNVIGGSMSPAIEHGDQVVINPTLHARPGNDCVFVHEQGDGILLAVVKRLVRANMDHWKVKQFSPAEEFQLPKKKWVKVYVIAEIRRGV